MLNKKMKILETSQEKLSNNLKEEIDQREKIERKIFQMNEGFNNKFSQMQKGIDEFSSIITEQITDLNTKLFDQLGSNHKNSSKNIEELIKKNEIMEKDQNTIINEHKVFKIETNNKILSLDENSKKFINLTKKDISDSLSKYEYVIII